MSAVRRESNLLLGDTVLFEAVTGVTCVHYSRGSFSVMCVFNSEVIDLVVKVLSTVQVAINTPTL